MCKATIKLIAPSGVPVTLEVGADDDQKEIVATLNRADAIGAYFLAHGWGAAHADATASGPSAGELASGPTFAGYPCSPTVDASGLPTWIIANGRQCMRHDKQGDTWWSLKLADGGYEQVLRVAKGEIAPPVKGL